MVDNQHKHIKGYRDLSQDEINLMNEVKIMAEQARVMIERIKGAQPIIGAGRPAEENAQALEWLEKGTKDLQVGFMEVVRSIARPSTF
jgi:hypothetical protein